MLSRPRVRHKGLEPSLRKEPDPNSGASTNSANAAISPAKILQIIDLNKQTDKIPKCHTYPEYIRGHYAHLRREMCRLGRKKK